MNKGRSTYTFQINCDPSVANDLVQAYIQGNKFTLQNKDGEQFYRAGDAMLEGYRYFNYSINGQTLTIQAWFKGAFGDMSIEQNSLNMPAMNYRNSLGKLFQEIEKLNNGGTNMNNNGMNFDPNTGQPLNQNMNNNGMNFDPNTGQPLNQGYQQPMNQNYGQPMQQNNQFAQSFQDETTKKQEKMCEWGFWLSIFGLLASFVGVAYGVIVYILNFYFASQGLKTRKRGKAIATIVMSIISIIIIVLQVAAA